MELTIDQRWDLVERISKETVEVGAYEPTLRDALAARCLCRNARLGV